MTAPSAVQPSTGAIGDRLHVALFALTFSTGLIDAVSFLALGRVFTANMTGNVVFLAFAIAGVQGLSVPRAAVSLVAFMAGAVGGGIINIRFAHWVPERRLKESSRIEGALLLAAAVMGWVAPHSVYAFIILSALAMGVRNAIVRKLGVADITTTVLTMTVTGLAADSRLAGGSNPQWKTRAASIVMMCAGAAAGALLVRYGVAAPFAASSIVAFAVFVGMRR
ncbi:MAG TPA: YoaK family protein [Thermoanaerobaculia bacterium]|jgi:uncharacterized membrane protein YoaK (UPF0700 family)|nr:YoaK family protein [Thermoanaerobaculia bacterium]